MFQLEEHINEYRVDEYYFTVSTSIVNLYDSRICIISLAPIIYHCYEMNVKTKSSQRMKDVGTKRGAD